MLKNMIIKKESKKNYRGITYEVSKTYSVNIPLMKNIELEIVKNNKNRNFVIIIHPYYFSIDTNGFHYKKRSMEYGNSIKRNDNIVFEIGNKKRLRIIFYPEKKQQKINFAV